LFPVEPTYGIEELAERAGVSRRTVRYYVQRGLLPAPTGLGRGRHYTEAHLATLVRIRELQEAGVPLADIAARLAQPEFVSPQGRDRGVHPEPSRAGTREPATREPAALEPRQSSWTRVRLSDDLEVHVRGRRLDEETLRALERAVTRVFAATGARRSGEGRD
jgi:DNA-binding transcriptional MerR regulator